MDSSVLLGIAIVEAHSDPELLVRAARGDKSAFEALYARHHKAVFDFAWRFTRSVSAAEDITQDAYVAVLLNVQRFRPERSSIRNWLLGIARNLALKRFRKLSPEQSLELEPEGRAAANRTPFEEALSSEVSAAVRAAVGSLPPLQREVLILSEYEGLAIAEIAVILGADPSAVKSRLHRARERLRILLAQLRPDGGSTDTDLGGDDCDERR